jgi:hypothetical protein
MQSRGAHDQLATPPDNTADKRDLVPFNSMHTGSTTMSNKIQVSNVDRWRLQAWLGMHPAAKPKVCHA